MNPGEGKNNHQRLPRHSVGLVANSLPCCLVIGSCSQLAGFTKAGSVTALVWSTASYDVVRDPCD